MTSFLLIEHWNRQCREIVKSPTLETDQVMRQPVLVNSAFWAEKLY